jgi:hypothetical protein
MELIPFTDLKQMAVHTAASQLFGLQNQDQAIALMLLCQAEGLHPAVAMRDYHIIKNKPCLKSDALATRFLNAGGSYKFIEYSDTIVTCEFTYKNQSLKVSWDIDRARKAGLVREDSQWIKQPRVMLKARVLAEGIRAVCPSVLGGMITKEEAEDIVKDIPAVVTDVQTEVKSSEVKTPEIVKPTAKQTELINECKETAKTIDKTIIINAINATLNSQYKNLMEIPEKDIDKALAAVKDLQK